MRLRCLCILAYGSYLKGSRRLTVVVIEVERKVNEYVLVAWECKRRISYLELQTYSSRRVSGGACTNTSRGGAGLSKEEGVGASGLNVLAEEKDVRAGGLTVARESSVLCGS
jgi:hypothetical protein